MNRQLVIFGIVVFVAGCTVHPAGEQSLRDTATQAGKPFAQRIDDRQLPALTSEATPDQLVQYALLSNAELEQHYWEWRSAIEQIPQDGTQSASLNVALGTNITNGRAAWRSSTISLSNDPMTDLNWPCKLDAAAKQALENSRAAGQRFTKAKFELRRKVLDAYYDYALSAELIRLEQSNLALLKTTAIMTQAGSRTGNTSQADALKAENDVDLSANDIAAMQSQLPGQRAAINAILNRPADAPLSLPNDLPPFRALGYSDADLVSIASKQNPELLAQASEIQARGDAVKLAKLQYIPDFNLSAGTDLAGITQSLLGQATIPAFRYEAIEAAIKQAEANLQASQAMREQAGNDLAAQVLADLAMVHDADRQLDLFEKIILPRSRQIAAVIQSAYETGQSHLSDILESQRSLIAIKRLIAQLKVTREKARAELESIIATWLR